MTTEQIITVKKARARLQGKSTWATDKFNMNDKYAQLKDLKPKHENFEKLYHLKIAFERNLITQDEYIKRKAILE